MSVSMIHRPTCFFS